MKLKLVGVTAMAATFAFTSCNNDPVLSTKGQCGYSLSDSTCLISWSPSSATDRLCSCFGGMKACNHTGPLRYNRKQWQQFYVRAPYLKSRETAMR